jgi:probable rRNA maturation factor
LLDVDVIGDVLPATVVTEACVLAAASAGIEDGHVAVEFVDIARITALNAEHRGKDSPTDVLSFPIDGRSLLPDGVPRQLGDLVVCPAVASAEGTPIATLLVHGVLHLVGYDHETDGGAMLVRQNQLLAEVAPVVADPA